MADGRIDLLDSDKMDLVMPEDPMSKITNGKILKMWRPHTEKEDRKKTEAAAKAQAKEADK